MKKNTFNLLIILTLIISLLSLPVLGSTKSFSDLSSVNTSDVLLTDYEASNSSKLDLGGSYTYTLQNIIYTDASTNPNASEFGCGEALILHYGTDTDVSSSKTLLNTNETSSVTDLGDVTARFVMLESSFTYNASISNCSITGITLSYAGGIGENTEALPVMGTQIGTFLSNLAPGLGAFIIIIAILTGIAGIIGVVVLLIKSKVGSDNK